MDWIQLMSDGRVASDGKVGPSSLDGRSPFERDWDRIIFSTAFRRLHDKTQVFPLPEDDVVHSRLTHSLEVASVGRSLGTSVGEIVREGYNLPNELSAAAFGDVVAAACLAHDIGNPPLGHAGEDAIGRFFRLRQHALGAFSERQRTDLQMFEGNAQGFRILTRLQLEEYGGLRLTAATLGAFLKYPRESGDDLKNIAGAASKKFGVFQSESEVLKSLAATLGLSPYISTTGGRGWKRHPLAYIVEAADDICNSILDLEDGVRLKYVNFDELQKALSEIVQDASTYSAERYRSFRTERDKIGYLRALAIGVLIKDCISLFRVCGDDLLAGRDVEPFADKIPHKGALANLLCIAKSKCYNAADVLEIELSGYEALGGLLARFAEGAWNDKPQRGTLEARALQFLTERSLIEREQGAYQRALRITDYVSGMTDRYALSLYRRTSGISIPGRLA